MDLTVSTLDERMAFIEAPAFLLGLGYFLHRDYICLVLALTMVAWMALHFPTQARVANWLASRRQMVQDERRLAPL